jgi:hypothetical protein
LAKNIFMVKRTHMITPIFEKRFKKLSSWIILTGVLYPNPKKLRIQISWVSRDRQQLKSAFFGDPSIDLILTTSLSLDSDSLTPYLSKQIFKNDLLIKSFMSTVFHFKSLAKQLMKVKNGAHCKYCCSLFFKKSCILRKLYKTIVFL